MCWRQGTTHLHLYAPQQVSYDIAFSPVLWRRNWQLKRIRFYDLTPHIERHASQSRFSCPSVNVQGDL